MSRKLLPFLAVILGFVQAGGAQSTKKSALDKATLEAYIRHMYVMDSRIAIQITDPKPAELPGFMEVMVHASLGAQTQDIPLYLSKDGSKIVQGSVFDIANNPFKPDLDKLKTDNTPGIGTTGAPVSIVEFSDFECPYCKEEARVLHDNLVSTYPKQVKLYFKDYPLETLHPWAKAAALAGRCVFRQKPEAFWTYHDWIFGSQDQTNADNLKDRVYEWAKGQKDIDSLQLRGCMENKQSEPDVARTIAEAKALNVNSTPTLFVNGRRIAQAIDWPSLKNIIDYEIEYQKTAKNAGDDCGCSFDLNIFPKSGPTTTLTPTNKN